MYTVVAFVLASLCWFLVDQKKKWAKHGAWGRTSTGPRLAWATEWVPSLCCLSRLKIGLLLPELLWWIDENLPSSVGSWPHTVSSWTYPETVPGWCVCSSCIQDCLLLLPFYLFIFLELKAEPRASGKPYTRGVLPHFSISLFLLFFETGSCYIVLDGSYLMKEISGHHIDMVLSPVWWHVSILPVSQ